jgi:Ca-activated chloride channel family protein
VPAVAFLLTVTGLVLGMARPMMDVQVPRERATIVVAVDVSMSMGAQDVAPSRIEAAVAAAREFVAALPPAFPVGLVLFDGSSTLAVPPTPDRAAVAAAFDRITLGPGTAIGDAVHTALDAVGTDGGADPPPSWRPCTPTSARRSGTAPRSAR